MVRTSTSRETDVSSYQQVSLIVPPVPSAPKTAPSPPLSLPPSQRVCSDEYTMRSGDPSLRAISFAPSEFPDPTASPTQMDVNGMLNDLCTVALARQGQPSRSTDINRMPPPSPLPPPIQLPTVPVGRPLFQISRAPSDEPVPMPGLGAVTAPAPATCGIRRELDLLEDESRQRHVKRIRLDQAEKQTARNYTRHVENFIKWWELSDAERRAAQPELRPVPALPITAVKASFFLEHESTRMKVSLCPFV